ncbi:MAG: four helix bundle protein [Candidatus Magasanikbacteria bacterium]|nr:four helix bundle protein [Candidatus Magasanikbacteria bacterium]
MPDGYLLLRDLLPYKTALELSGYIWKIYERLDWHDHKIIGDQFITSVDSTGANIAEGYGRYHYLDRIKFYYNARGSALEAKHWTLLLYERKKVSREEYDYLIAQLNQLHFQLNSFIKACYPKK